ncbi:MAG TPA: heme lyase CcmF/NrfE family subunit [Candidatus Acidoferrales bacterium]|nr:heme lyase CcmF/NrfE family subunit [Candidatus Acidoferrales bacterium]
MDIFGSFALLLALLCAGYAIIGGIFAIRTRNPFLIKSARNAGFAVCILIFLAAASLIELFLSNNFSVAYVVEHSSRLQPTFLKIAALWSGQEGSLLFWSLLLAVYVFSVLWTYRGKHPELMPYVGVIMASVQFFFLLLNNFIESPFRILGAAGAGGATQWLTLADGNGLNPLLQYPEMIIHPPMLYSGYTGFTIPFAFALAALLGRYPGEKWIHLTRRWTMIAWCFQSVGILLGAHWAYAVLGWGGYWSWDPVENASLMPWLTGTAFLHSVMMQEKRGMMKVWNVWLVFCTFMLCIFGTFLTRSGVVSSVHAFAESSIGPWFVGFLIVIFAVCLLAYLKNKDYLRSDNQLDSLVSRESSFLFNNLILLVACVAVLSGTLFPVLSEAVTNNKISVGAPFFNHVNIPVGLMLLFLTGIGPLLAWRKTSIESLKRNFLWPLVGGLIAGAVAWPLGCTDLFSLVCVILCVFVTLTIVSEFYRGAKVLHSRGAGGYLASLTELTLRNTRRYGGYVVHFGIVLVFIGLSGAAFNRDKQMDMPPGTTMHIGPYSLFSQSVDTIPGANYEAERVTIEVSKGNKSVMMLFPERRNFASGQENGTMVAIYSTLREDLYVVYAGRNPDNFNPIIHAYLNPLVKWIWFGGVVVVLGTILGLIPSRQAALAIRATAAQPAHEAVPQFATAAAHSDHAD